MVRTLALILLLAGQGVARAEDDPLARLQAVESEVRELRETTLLQEARIELLNGSIAVQQTVISKIGDLGSTHSEVIEAIVRRFREVEARLAALEARR